jgi:hypothetical protein
LLSSLRTNLNLGVRHILPLYPFVFLMVGIAAVRALRLWPRTAPIVLAALGASLAAETLAAYPNYIPFFSQGSRLVENLAKRADEGRKARGFYLLGDSNLDWGQDMPALAQWRLEHPEGTLYIDCFGLVDPAVYGLKDYVNVDTVQRESVFHPRAQPLETITEPGYLAISATQLQGIYRDARARAIRQPLRMLDPYAILGGGSIYIYRIALH